MDSWSLAISFSVCLCVASTFFFFLFYTTDGKSGKKEGRPPPSPPSLPLISNLLWMKRPLADLGRAVHTFAGEYGPVFSFKFGLFPSIFISDTRLAHEALVVKGAVFSDRPRFGPAGAGYIYTSDGHTVVAGNDTLWRLLRRNLTSGVLHPSRFKSYAPARSRALGRLLDGLRAMSAAAAAGGGVVVLAECLGSPMFGLLSHMCFGETLADGAVEEIEGVQRALLLMGFKLYVFDIMPRLAKLVLRREWTSFLAARRRQEAVLGSLIRARRDELDAERRQQRRPRSFVSYVDTLLDLELPEEGGRKLTEEEMVSLCSEFFNAGVDSTATTLQWVMANLVRSPDVQERLFREIRGAVGAAAAEGGAGIKEEDLQGMPYLKAVIYEALRRHPPAPMLLPHVATEDTDLGGYLIPRGAVVNVTVGKFGWDGGAWEDPMEFRPERFMPGGEGDGLDITGSREIRMMPFGAGRRICPGMALAMLHLEYFVANLVWEFEWRRVDGEEVDLSATVEQLTMTMKRPLRARIYPRNCE